MKKNLLFALILGASVQAMATPVTVTMNTSTKEMVLTAKESGDTIRQDSLAVTGGKNMYIFNSLQSATYVISGFDAKGNMNGTMELEVGMDSIGLQIWTVTSIKASNKGWVLDQDYTIENLTCRTREGQVIPVTLGTSSTAGAKSALMINGGSYNCTIHPNDSLISEGYMDAYASATLTANISSNVSVPLGGDYSVTFPTAANFGIFRKEGGSNGSGSIHYIPFTLIEPKDTVVEGETTTYIYRLANSNTYNFRLWQENKRTMAGKFVYYTDSTQCPVLAFTAADLDADPRFMDTDPTHNNVYNVGNILLNINGRGHLNLKSGQTYDLLAQRDWQLTDNSTNNYFIEPDYHYTVLGIDGKSVTDIVSIDNANTTVDPWALLKANGQGEAIVLVTYDAINLNQWAKQVKSTYLGGENWSALWPENTGVFVVSVDAAPTSLETGMVINEKYNAETMKNAGKYIDAEHDCFYYLEEDSCFEYSFKPAGVAKVEICYPTILADGVSYENGFIGVEKSDTVYTLKLRRGRQIVRLTGTDGGHVYQVLTAKPVTRTITNLSNPGSDVYCPGDQVKVQYNGLYHPANKMAGIYNMSAYITYNGVPTGTELILGSNQYNFAGTPKAQAVTVAIPDDQSDTISLTEGVLQVTGYGDPIGNHRNISKIGGRNPNFTAIAHKTYFGAVPSVNIPVTLISLKGKVNVTNADSATIVLKNRKGTALVADSLGFYALKYYGKFDYEATAKGYGYTRGSIVTNETSDSITYVSLELPPVTDSNWNGDSIMEPAFVDGLYQIGTGYELAWFAKQINDGNNYSAVLTNDIDLIGFDWTPIGNNSKTFKGKFDGQGHRISGLYINSTKTYQALFGYADGAEISNLSVDGTVITTGNYAAGIVAYAKAASITGCVNYAEVNGKQYVAGVVSYMYGATTVDRCANCADITASSTYAAGISAYVQAATGKISNSFNRATITGTGNVAGIANLYSTAAAAEISNVYNSGSIICDAATKGSIFSGTAAAAGSGVKNAYSVAQYDKVAENETIVTEYQMEEGEVAYKLNGDQSEIIFRQTLGEDKYPSFIGLQMYYFDGQYCNDTIRTDANITFDDVDLKGARFYNGSDEAGLFTSGKDYSFMSYYDSNYASWCGFAVSATLGKNFNGYADYTQFNSCTGLGLHTRQFAVGYYSEYNALMDDQYPEIYAAKSFKPEYVYVNNTANTLQSMTYGDAWAKKFAVGDSLVLTITGLTEDDEETGSIDFYLAKDTVFVTEWTKVDLTSLGTVDHIRFTMKSSDMSWGFMNTPAYFCIDDMKASLTDEKPIPASVFVPEKSHTDLRIYDIYGRQVENPQNGMYIINGKKYLIK